MKMATHGTIIRKWRQAKGWTLKDLERESRVHSSTLSALENDLRSTRKPTLQAVCEALGKSIKALQIEVARGHVTHDPKNPDDYSHKPAEHRRLHRMLQEILDFSRDAEFVMKVDIESVLARVRQGDLERPAPGEPGEE